MKLNPRQALKKLAGLVVSPGIEPAVQAARIHAFQRDVILPIKALLIVALVYYFYFSNWIDQPRLNREFALKTIFGLFLFYVLTTIAIGSVFIFVRRLPLHVLQGMVFVMGLLDGLLFASLILVTGGFDSIIFWIFPALIIHNALSISLATPQIVLNLVVCLFYGLASALDVFISDEDAVFLALDSGTRHALDFGPTENLAEPFLLRILLLVLLTFCCYGVQALFEKQRRAEEEAEEFTFRQEQLHSAGRLAAQIAHQIKNPLSIINNASFSLQRAVQDGKSLAAEQIQIIREEVEHADRIITELMGYAQLAEGTVEKISVTEELERAIAKVFPAAAKYNVEIRRDYMSALPALMMQRNHLSEIFVNILQNGREAMQDGGTLAITAEHGANFSVVITIADSGPGIPKDKVAKIFEPYFSTKTKGTGLGLAIVKHNVEIYGGKVSVESELGKGSRFTLQFPAKTLMKLSQ
jgi:signal transduction histidine kinase